MMIRKALSCGALALLTLCVAACSGTRAGRTTPVARDAYYQRVSTSALAAFDRGDPVRAAELYRQALQRARAMDRASEISAAAYHTGIALAASGEWAASRIYFAEAMAEADRAGESRLDAWLADAEAAWQTGQQDDAWAQTEAMLVALDNVDAPSWLLHIYLLRALMATEVGTLDVARENLALAQSIQARSRDRRLSARLMQAEGALLLAEESPLLAAVAFDREAQIYRDAEAYKDMAVALARAGDAYELADDDAMAADRYFRAARSFHAQQLPAQALRQIEAALQVMERTGPSALAERVALLVEEIETSLKKKEP
jgi:hypothetical protein